MFLSWVRKNKSLVALIVEQQSKLSNNRSRATTHAFTSSASLLRKISNRAGCFSTLVVSISITTTLNRGSSDLDLSRRRKTERTDMISSPMLELRLFALYKINNETLLGYLVTWPSSCVKTGYTEWGSLMSGKLIEKMKLRRELHY